MANYNEYFNGDNPSTFLDEIRKPERQNNSLFSSLGVEYFFEEGELFIGVLILVFTFIFPILKYIYLGSKLVGFQFKGSKISEIIKQRESDFKCKYCNIFCSFYDWIVL